MGKQNSKRHQERMKARKALKAKKAVLYQSLAGNTVRKRDRLNRRPAQAHHTQGPCGNTGCALCNPRDNTMEWRGNLFIRPGVHAHRNYLRSLGAK